MAFINEEGRSISYDCSEYIEWLKEDMLVCGGDTLVDVVVEDVHGVPIYKNYVIRGSGELLPRMENERVQIMTITALMTAYEAENSIF